MATITERRAKTAGIAALAPYKAAGVGALSDEALMYAATSAGDGPNWGGDPQFVGACRAEMSKRGILAAYDASQVSPNYGLTDILKSAVVFYGTAYAAASGLQAIQATAPAATATPAVTATPTVSAGAVTAGGGGSVVSAASAGVAAPMVTTSGAASAAGIGAAVVDTAAGIAATATTAIVAAKVQKEVAPPAPGTNVGLPIVNDAGVQPNDQPATRSAGITAPLALAALLVAAFIL